MPGCDPGSPPAPNSPTPTKATCEAVTAKVPEAYPPPPPTPAKLYPGLPLPPPPAPQA